MKLILAISLAVGLASAWDRTPKQKLMYKLQEWVRGATHCAEYATDENGLDEEKADECRRCHAGVGNWGTEEGMARGVECLNTYEPEFMEMCGDKMEAFSADPSFVNELAADNCWEECNLRRIAGKCIEATGGEDMNMGMLCVMKHLTDNVKYARHKIFGDKHNAFLQPSKMEQEVEYLMEEGRCEHASEGNAELKMECNMCFNHVNQMTQKLLKESDGKFDTDTVLPGVTMWIACADNYWSPHYSECFEGVDDLVGHIKEWNTAEYKSKQDEIQACFMLKQSQHWFQACKEGSGDGSEGLVNFVHCARNTTLTWAADKRPQAAEYVRQWMNGGSLSLEDM